MTVDCCKWGIESPAIKRTFEVECWDLHRMKVPKQKKAQQTAVPKDIGY